MAQEDVTPHPARLIYDTPEIRDVLWLVKNGVPWDVALSLDPDERMVFCIIFGEFEGGQRFNWQSMTWEKREP